MRNARDPVNKTFAILRWMLQESDGTCGVREIAAALDIAPSTAHGLLQAAVEVGILQQRSDSGRYFLSIEMYRIAELVGQRNSIRSIAQPHLEDLVSRSGKTVLLQLYDDRRQEMIINAGYWGAEKLAFRVEMNKWKPVYAGASGMAVMANLPRHVRDNIVLRTGLAPVTSRTITDPDLLEAELDKIRGRGYAITSGQRVRGAVGIAAPFFGPQGVLGDVVFAISENTFNPVSEPSLAALLLECTEALTSKLGGRKARQA